MQIHTISPANIQTNRTTPQNDAQDRKGRRRRRRFSVVIAQLWRIRYTHIARSRRMKSTRFVRVSTAYCTVYTNDLYTFAVIGSAKHHLTSEPTKPNATCTAMCSLCFVAQFPQPEKIPIETVCTSDQHQQQQHRQPPTTAEDTASTPTTTTTIQQDTADTE